MKLKIENLILNIKDLANGFLQKDSFTLTFATVELVELGNDLEFLRSVDFQSFPYRRQLTSQV